MTRTRSRREEPNGCLQARTQTAAAAARVDLVALGRGVHELNWGSGVVCENVDGLVGVCEDSGNADPGYTWGALYGFTAFVEGGVY